MEIIILSGDGTSRRLAAVEAALVDTITGDHQSRISNIRLGHVYNQSTPWAFGGFAEATRADVNLDRGTRGYLNSKLTKLPPHFDTRDIIFHSSFNTFNVQCLPLPLSRRPRISAT
jgi:hypothetical protein